MRDVVAGIVVRGQTRPPPPAVLVAFRFTICRFLCPISLIILLLNHAGDVVRMCNYHTRALRHVRKHLTTATPQTIACSVICHRSTTATRCCMALLLQLSRSCRELKTTSPGTSVSNADVFTLPLLQSLHWLPVHQRIQYKIAVITHKALSTSVPPYIDELLQRQVMTRSLRSTDAPRLSVPWTRTETAKRAFCVAVRTSGTHYRMTFVTPVHCERSVPN